MPMQIGGVAVPEAVVKAMAGLASQPSLPTMGAVTKLRKVDEDGYEVPARKKTVT